MFNKLMVLVGLFAIAAVAVAKDDFPAVSHDGLHLMPDTKLRAVYMRPGADLSEYDKIYLVDAYVAFKKNWKRDHNDEEAWDQQVNDKQMKDIRERVAKSFAKEFTEVLSTRGGHEVVTEGGEGVLIIRPAIVNLDVTAPDLMSPQSTSVVASAGSMTLYMELYDGKTQDIIARVIDPEAADNAGLARVANRVTNTADFERVMRRWAEILNAHLAEVKK
ncbi:MAG: DUF3313 family protein [Halioglobus sp.]